MFKNKRLLSDNFIAKFCFFVLSFSVLFGTDLPFTQSPENVSEIMTSNISNQIVYSSIFLLSIVFIVLRHKEFFDFLKKESYLSILMIWMLLSIFWSNYFFVSFKRYFQLLTLVLVLINAVVFIDRKELFKYLKILFYIYVPLNLFSVFFIPQAIDPAFNTWRGMSYSKNLFGQIGIVILLFCTTIYFLETKRLQKIGVLITGFIAIVFVVMSVSSTSIISLMIIFFFAIAFLLDRVFRPLKIKYIYTSIILPFLILIFFSSMVFYPEIFDTLTTLVGKDPTFTGRTALWNDILNYAQKHLIWGCGYGGFWVVDSENIKLLYKVYNWLPNEAHNGFIDLTNELGIIGIGLFLILILVNIFRAIKIEDRVALLVVITVLVTNYTESSLFKVGWPLNFMFILYYLGATKSYLSHKYQISH